MLRNRYKQFKDDYRKEAEWQRELRENMNEERQRRKKEAEKNKNRSEQDVKRIRENAKTGKLNKIKSAYKGAKNAGSYIKLLVKPWTLAKYMGGEGDGVYFVIFIFSVIFDLISVITGGLSGAVSWMPGVDVISEAGNLWLVAFANAVIIPLYVLAGHYKKTLAGRQFMKVVAQFGFSFLELLPGIAILPGFIGAFLVNYWLVLYSRAVEDLSN